MLVFGTVICEEFKIAARTALLFVSSSSPCFNAASGILLLRKGRKEVKLASSLHYQTLRFTIFWSAEIIFVVIFSCQWPPSFYNRLIISSF
jgi:hypothetical protein